MSNASLCPCTFAIGHCCSSHQKAGVNFSIPLNSGWFCNFSWLRKGGSSTLCKVQSVGIMRPHDSYLYSLATQLPRQDLARLRNGTTKWWERSQPSIYLCQNHLKPSSFCQLTSWTTVTWLNLGKTSRVIA